MSARLPEKSDAGAPRVFAGVRVRWPNGEDRVLSIVDYLSMSDAELANTHVEFQNRRETIAAQAASRGRR